jgi:kinesin family protein 5
MDNGSTEDLSSEDFITIRRQLSEGQNLLRETVDRLRQSQEKNDMLARRRDELEARVTTLETDYEELLGKRGSIQKWQLTNFGKWAEKTINDEETNNVDVADMMADLKVCYLNYYLYLFSVTWFFNLQNKLELQYAAKREAQLNEVSDLKQQLEIRNNELCSLNASIDSLKSVNEELKVRVTRNHAVHLYLFLSARICCHFRWDWRR